MRRALVVAFWLALGSACFAQTLGPPGGSSGGGNTSFANPTATAGPNAVNGSATTAMRSDAAPAVQLGSSSQAGLIQCGSGTTCSGGTMSVSGGGSGGVPGTFQSGLLNFGATPVGGSSLLMNGFGSTCAFTARANGIAQISFYGVFGPSGGITQSLFNEIRYANSGITSAPTMGAALTGTLAGVEKFEQALDGQQLNQNTSNSAIITGLTSGAQYWFDIALQTTATTSAYFQGTCSALFW